MHTLVKLTSQEGQLLRELGNGRETFWEGGRLSLGFNSQPRCELMLECRVDGQLLQMGMLEAQWCSWITTELPVPSWTMLAQELRLPMAALTLEPMQEALKKLDLPFPTPLKFDQAASDTPQSGWFLRLEQEGRSLTLQLLNVSLKWLKALIDTLQPVAQTSNVSTTFNAPVSLAAGWSTLERKRLDGIRCGDALLLRRSCPVAKAQLFLFMQRPLCIVEITAPDTCLIESLMSNVNDWLDIQPLPATDAPADSPELLVTVVAEVASLELPLNRIMSLKQGEILEGRPHQNELVTLKIAGRTFAYGNLLDIDGHLAVRIERLA